LSSWGATIMGIMAPLLAGSALLLTQVEAFVLSAAMNYYAIAALILLWLTILLGLDFGGMRSQERRAVRGDGLFNENEETPGQLSDEMPSHEVGGMWSLILPFALVLVGVVAGMYISRVIICGAWDVLTTLAEADVAIALNVGGIAAMFSASYYCIY